MHVYTRIYVERPILSDLAFERGRLCGGYIPWDHLYTYLHLYIYSGEPVWSDLTFERVPLCSLDIHFNTCMHVYTRIYVEGPILSDTRHWRSFLSQFAQISAYSNAWAFAIVRYFERLFCSQQLFSRPFFSIQAVCTARSCKHTYIEGRHAPRQRNEYQLGSEKTASVLHTCRTFGGECLGCSCAATNCECLGYNCGQPALKLWTLRLL